MPSYASSKERNKFFICHSKSLWISKWFVEKRFSAKQSYYFTCFVAFISLAFSLQVQVPSESMEMFLNWNFIGFSPMPSIAGILNHSYGAAWPYLHYNCNLPGWRNCVHLMDERWECGWKTPCHRSSSTPPWFLAICSTVIWSSCLTPPTQVTVNYSAERSISENGFERLFPRKATL